MTNYPSDQVVRTHLFLLPGFESLSVAFSSPRPSGIAQIDPLDRLPYRLPVFPLITSFRSLLWLFETLRCALIAAGLFLVSLSGFRGFALLAVSPFVVWVGIGFPFFRLR